MARRRPQRSAKFVRLGTAPEPIVVLPITLPASVYQAVERTAAQRNWSKAAVVRAALEQFLTPTAKGATR